MAWCSANYVAPSHLNWQGRSDAPNNACFYQRIACINLTADFHVHNIPTFAILGFCSDEGIKRNLGRLGAALGPDAIRKALGPMPFNREHIYIIDVGDIICADTNLESAQQSLASAIHYLLTHKMIPIVLGGGHELAFGHFTGIAQAKPQEQLNIINFDAHFDMREHTQSTSGTPFKQIADSCATPFNYFCLGIQQAGNLDVLFETAKKYNVQYLLAETIHQDDSKLLQTFLDKLLQVKRPTYLSLCLDVFATPYAPGVSAPQILGLTPWQVIPMLRKIIQSQTIISYDIAEMSPPFDQDHRTAKLAANLINEIILHHPIT